MAADLGAGPEADVGRALTGLCAAAAATTTAGAAVGYIGTKVASIGGAYASARRAREAAPLAGP
jgi:hypothetical protein